MASAAALVSSTMAGATTPPDENGAAGGVGEVGGSGCGIPHGPYDDPGVEPSGEARPAHNDPLLSFNNNTIHSNAFANSIPLYMMQFNGFSYYDSDLELVNNDQFGTCTIESLEPLSVTYRVNEGVTWSDGVPVDAADLILTWGAMNTHFNDDDVVVLGDGTRVAGDEDGSPILTGPDDEEILAADEDAYAAAFDEDGALLEGYSYIESAGVNFNSSSESYQLITETPAISDDGQAVTATWDEFYVDYQIGGIDTSVPAHIVASRALDIDDPMDAKAAVVDAFVNNERETLAALSEFWNTGFDYDTLPGDEGVYIGHGPYNLVAYEQRSEMIFEARDDYDWGPKPQVQTIVYRIIGDPSAAVQAMENEEVDIIQPQATSDILVQLEALEDRGIVVSSGVGATYEHIDFAVANGGPFDPAAYDGDEDTARMVRQAFMYTIPRQEIVERLIQPLNPDAEIRGSFTQVPGAPWYDEFVENNGLQEYDEVNIDAAVALLEEAGVETPVEVRFHYAADNPRRAAQYELVRDSAALAGFDVLDGASPTWSQELSNTDLYDAAMFGWISVSLPVTVGQANFVTGGANNFYGYSSEAVDGLYDELLGTADPERQKEILLEVEQQLVEDAFGVTIYQFPEIFAYNSTYVEGVRTIPLVPTFYHAFWEWRAV